MLLHVVHVPPLGLRLLSNCLGSLFTVVSIYRAAGVVSISELTSKLVSGAVSGGDPVTKAKVNKYKTVS